MGKRTTSRSESAYTIIEILVALSIAGIIFGVGFVSFREFSRRQALASAGRALKGDLRLTQEYSLIGKKPEDPKCSGSNTLVGYKFLVISSSKYVIRAACSGGDVDVKAVDLAGDIIISSPSPNPITFKVLGEGTNVVGSAAVTLTQSTTESTTGVTITQGGEIK